MPRNPIEEFLNRTHLGLRQASKALTLWPLLFDAEPDEADSGPEYVPLGDALEDGFVGVEELSKAGSVPQVRVQNRGSASVLVLFGEELRGAKQNRVANATFLVPPKQELEIDVSCVEQGRWGRRAGAGRERVARFQASADVVSHLLRRKMARGVGRSRSVSRAFDAGQSEVWSEVSERLASSGTRSASVAWADYARSRARDLAELSKAFRPVEGQVGFVASIGDEVVGLEAIGRPGVFARVFPKLLHAYAIDAIDSGILRRDASAVRFDAPEPFLTALCSAPETSTGASLGLGQDLRLQTRAVEGCALAAEGALIHLTAFPHSEEGPEEV